MFQTVLLLSLTCETPINLLFQSVQHARRERTGDFVNIKMDNKERGAQEPLSFTMQANSKHSKTQNQLSGYMFARGQRQQ